MDGSFTIRSLDKIAAGGFTFFKKVLRDEETGEPVERDGELIKVFEIFLYYSEDNGMSDCLGDSYTYSLVNLVQGVFSGENKMIWTGADDLFTFFLLDADDEYRLIRQE
ncbi:MAG: hypothetical protein HRU20_23450 [Pseudomonadales bacterium]|nr:hypothetical protein [Pseudomonadales bacterium]